MPEGTAAALRIDTSAICQLSILPNEGRTTKEVAALLGVSVSTAESHRSRILEKLDIHVTASLVRYAIRNGLIEAQVTRPLQAFLPSFSGISHPTIEGFRRLSRPAQQLTLSSNKAVCPGEEKDMKSLLIAGLPLLLTKRQLGDMSGRAGLSCPRRLFDSKMGKVIR
jgi:hypothetical protein